MKKGLLIIAVVSILIISLTACVTINVEESGIYGDFNRMAEESYSSIKVMAVTQKDGVVLTDTYNFNFADENGVIDKNKGTVTYVTQRLGEFTVVDGVLTPPEAFIIEKRGEAEVKNGTITQGGEEHLYQAVNGLSLNFKESYFLNVVTFDGGFEAKVSNPQGLFGTDKIQAVDMTIQITYSQGRFQKIQVNTVNEDGSKGTITYNFN